MAKMTSTISWKQIFDLSDLPNGEDRTAIIAALESIESSDIGQKLFQLHRDKSTIDPAYPQIIPLKTTDSEGTYFSNNNELFVNLEQIETINIISGTNKKSLQAINPTLDEALLHELTHAININSTHDAFFQDYVSARNDVNNFIKFMTTNINKQIDSLNLELEQITYLEPRQENEASSEDIKHTIDRLVTLRDHELIDIDKEDLLDLFDNIQTRYGGDIKKNATFISNEIEQSFTNYSDEQYNQIHDPLRNNIAKHALYSEDFSVDMTNLYRLEKDPEAILRQHYSSALDSSSIEKRPNGKVLSWNMDDVQWDMKELFEHIATYNQSWNIEHNSVESDVGHIQDLIKRYSQDGLTKNEEKFITDIANITVELKGTKITFSDNGDLREAIITGVSPKTGENISFSLDKDAFERLK